MLNKRKSIGSKHFNETKVFIKYSNNIQDIYKNINKYNPVKKRKVLIVFDDMIADLIIKKKKKKSIITKLFIRDRKLNIIFLFLLRCHIIRFRKMLD